MQLNDERADVSKLLANNFIASFLHESKEVHVLHARRGQSGRLDEFRMYFLVITEQHVVAHVDLNSRVAP